MITHMNGEILQWVQFIILINWCGFHAVLLPVIELNNSIPNVNRIFACKYVTRYLQYEPCIEWPKVDFFCHGDWVDTLSSTTSHTIVFIITRFCYQVSDAQIVESSIKSKHKAFAAHAMHGLPKDA